MHPSEFATRWRTRASLVTEAQADQEHSVDASSLVGSPVPGQAEAGGASPDRAPGRLA